MPQYWIRRCPATEIQKLKDISAKVVTACFREDGVYVKTDGDLTASELDKVVVEVLGNRIKVSVDDSQEASDVAPFVPVRSPDGRQWKITVGNDGVLSTELV